MLKLAEIQPELKPAIEFAGSRMMTPAEWSRVPPNPRQRDTATHAKRAKHLLTPHPTHMKVNMARLPDGSAYKLDGHTRSYLWDIGTVQAPTVLTVDVWDCRTMGDVLTLYTTFDSRGAVETVADQMFGAVRERGVVFESDALKFNRFANALRTSYDLLFGGHASRTAPVYDLLAYWLPELKLLEQCAPSSKRFNSGMIAAALITMRRHGPEALDFWSTYSRGGGTKLDDEMDAVQALAERFYRERSIVGREQNVRLVATTLSAFDRYLRGESYSINGSGIKAMQNSSLKSWLIRAKNTERTW